MHTEKTNGHPESSRPRRCCLPTLAPLSSSPSSYSTACHQHSPPLFRPRCGWCSAWPCDEREGPREIFNATSLTHPLQSIMSERISTALAWIISFLWLCLPCNLSAAALSSPQLDLIQQHLQDYIWQRSRAPARTQHNPRKPLYSRQHLTFPRRFKETFRSGWLGGEGPPGEPSARPQTRSTAPSAIAPRLHIKLPPEVTLHSILYCTWPHAACWPDWSQRGRGQRSASAPRKRTFFHNRQMIRVKKEYAWSLITMPPGFLVNKAVISFFQEPLSCCDEELFFFYEKKEAGML